jgi:hypothetical protein
VTYEPHPARGQLDAASTPTPPLTWADATSGKVERGVPCANPRRCVRSMSVVGVAPTSVTRAGLRETRRGAWQEGFLIRQTARSRESAHHGRYRSRLGGKINVIDNDLRDGGCGLWLHDPDVGHIRFGVVCHPASMAMHASRLPCGSHAYPVPSSYRQLYTAGGCTSRKPRSCTSTIAKTSCVSSTVTWQPVSGEHRRSGGTA